jgi:hypothetical protein
MSKNNMKIRIEKNFEFGITGNGNISVYFQMLLLML